LSIGRTLSLAYAAALTEALRIKILIDPKIAIVIEAITTLDFALRYDGVAHDLVFGATDSAAFCTTGTQADDAWIA
jgi:hypothetical protein